MQLGIARFSLAAWLCSMVGVASAGTITITPATPTPADPIHIVVDDSFPYGPANFCWEVDHVTCTLSAPDSVLVTAYIQHCNGASSCFCTAQPVDFQVTCDFPPLPNGTYRAVYQEIQLNPFDDRNLAPYSRLFTVAGPTPVLRRSWGRLKAHYR